MRTLRNLVIFAMILLPALAFGAGVTYTNPSTGGEVDVTESRGLPVAGYVISASDSFASRPANTTAYAASQWWNRSLTVSGATNASPIVITTSASHGLAAGQYVTIASVGGNTAANGTWKVGAVTSTTFQILNPDGSNTTGNASYTSGGTVAQLLVFHLARGTSGPGLTGYIQKAKLYLNSTTTTNGTFRLYLYNYPVSASVDQTTFALAWANRSYLVGYIDFVVGIEGSGGDAAMAVRTSLMLPYVAYSTGDLFGALVPEAAYAPTSGEQAHITLMADAN